MLIDTQCPFTVYGVVECVYIDSGGMCDAIEVNPGNSDSFCGGLVEEHLGKGVAQNSKSANKSSFQFPDIKEVYKMFNAWAKRKQDRDGNINTLELIKAIYDFVVGNKKH